MLSHLLINARGEWYILFAMLIPNDLFASICLLKGGAPSSGVIKVWWKNLNFSFQNFFFKNFVLFTGGSSVVFRPILRIPTPATWLTGWCWRSGAWTPSRPRRWRRRRKGGAVEEGAGQGQCPGYRELAAQEPLTTGRKAICVLFNPFSSWNW